MPFITKSNYKRILRKININSIVIDDVDLYKKPIYFLSSWEVKYLLIMKSLLKNPEKFEVEVYQKVINKDTLKYVYESELSPAYHNKKDCERLNSTYRNFEIPDEIKERAKLKCENNNWNEQESELEIKKAIEHFRHWFKININLFNEDLPEFIKQLDIRWNIQRNVNEIEKDNSGIEDIENLNLEELEREIDKVISQAGRYFVNNIDKQQIIRRFQKLTFLAYKEEPIQQNDTNLRDDELKEFLKFYDTEFKKPLKELLIQYYRIKYNPDLSFSGDLLDQLNFRPCSNCKNDSISTDNLV